MAKPQPKPQSQLVLFILWSVTLLLGYKMFFDKPKDARSEAQLLTVMREQNAKLLDQSIVATHHAYDAKINELEGEKDPKKPRLTKEEAQARRIESAVLTADTQLRAGLQREESARVRTAYNTLWAMDKKLHGNAQWNGQPIQTAGGTYTGQALFDKTGEALSDRNKRDLIWGFIPGGYAFIDSLVGVTGRHSAFSYAFAAFLLAFVVRLVVWPFSQRQLMHSRQMMQLAPLAQEIREEYKDDPQQLNIRTMALYKEYGLNPVAGCAPALVQMPLFFTVYQCMLLYQFEFQKGTFLWINPAANAASRGFFGANLGQLDPILILLYGISMIVSTLLTPVNDPAQRKQQRMIGVGASVVFTISMFTGLFPVVAGFVLYWTFTNIFSTLQSLRAYRMPLPPLQKVNAPNGGVFPTGPFGMGGKGGLFTGTATKDVSPNGTGSNGTGSNGTGTKGTGANGISSNGTSKNGNGKTGKPAQHRPKKRSK